MDEWKLSERQLMDFIKGYCKKSPVIILVLLKTILSFVGKLSNELLLPKNYFSISFFDMFSNYNYDVVFGNMTIDTGKGYTLKQDDRDKWRKPFIYFPEYEWSLKIQDDELRNGVKIMISTWGKSINDQRKLTPWVKNESLLLNEEDEEYDVDFEDNLIYFSGINVGLDGVAMTTPNDVCSIMRPYQGPTPFNRVVNDLVVNNEYTVFLRITNRRFIVIIVNNKDIIVEKLEWNIHVAKYRLMIWIKGT